MLVKIAEYDLTSDRWLPGPPLGVPHAGVPLGEEGEWYMEWRASGSSKVEWGISEYFSGNWLLFLTGSRY